VTDQEARYDRIAEGYATWWSPVHRPGTLGLLDEVDAIVAAGAQGLLDVGCGTGAMAADAVRRWPTVEVDGVDASAGMLELARAGSSSLGPDEAARLRYAQALADRLPFDDGSFDLALSAFVLQLVPSRFRALREMRRVLRPGGRLAYVTWLRGGERFAGQLALAHPCVPASNNPRNWPSLRVRSMSESSSRRPISGQFAIMARVPPPPIPSLSARGWLRIHAPSSLGTGLLDGRHACHLRALFRARSRTTKSPSP